MELNEFTGEVAKIVQKNLGGVFQVRSRDMVRNNGVRLSGMEISAAGGQAAPCISLERFFWEYKNGKPLEHIADDITAAYLERGHKMPFAMPPIDDFHEVRRYLKGRLVNTKKNAAMLKHVPHRPFLDLSMVCYLEIPYEDGNGFGIIQVNESELKMWGISEEDLFNEAMYNMENSEKICSMADVLHRILKDDTVPLPDFVTDECPMYILRNKSGPNGAIQMIRERVMERASDLIGGDYIIIPSSVHEILLVPVKGHEGKETELAKLVSEMNCSEITEEEILSFHVYRYSRADRKVSIVA